MDSKKICAIAGRIKLCSLSRSRWGATKLHKEQTKDLNDRNHSEAGKVSIKVCDHLALGKLAKLHGALYAAHIKMTLPTVQDGTRILPVTREFEHMEMVRKAKEEHEKLVAEFMSVYDDEAAQAPTKLNGYYDPKAWPSHDDMSKKFGLESHYLGCPTDGPWAHWLEESARAASDELRERLEEAVRHLAERCVGERLHKSVFSNLKELVDFIPEIDISDSENLIKLAQAARPLTAHKVEELRDSDKARLKVHDDASSVLDLFSSGSLS